MSMMMWLKRYVRFSTMTIEAGCNFIFGLLIVAAFVDESKNDYSVAKICIFCYTMFAGIVTNIECEIYTEDVEYLKLEDLKTDKKRQM